MEAPMRIILFLSALAGATAASGPAAAQSSGTMGAPRGPVHTVPGFRGGGVVVSMNPRFRRGMTGIPGRHDNPRPGRHRFDRGGDGFLYSYGLGETSEAIDPHGNGFFAGGGGEIRLRGGRPYYDYDRSYPYEWAPAAGGPMGWVVEGEALPPEAACGVERGVRVCRGRR
jgi:hypothetical protein